MAEELVWTKRFRELKEKGFTDEQLDIIFSLISRVDGFRFRWIEYSARRQLEAVKKGEEYGRS